MLLDSKVSRGSMPPDPPRVWDLTAPEVLQLSPLIGSAASFFRTYWNHHKSDINIQVHLPTDIKAPVSS